MTTATKAMDQASLAQKREEAAGSIIKPTAIKVPKARNPATRLRTTRIKKMKCIAAPHPPTDLR